MLGRRVPSAILASIFSCSPVRAFSGTNNGRGCKERCAGLFSSRVDHRAEVGYFGVGEQRTGKQNGAAYIGFIRANALPVGTFRNGSFQPARHSDNQPDETTRSTHAHHSIAVTPTCTTLTIISE